MPTVRRRDVSPDVWAKLEAAAGIAPAPAPRPRKRPRIATTGRTSRWSIGLTLACRIVSEANRRDHWTVRRRRSEIQAETLAKALAGAGLTNHTPPLPLVVTWVRIGKQDLDTDNLAGGFKALRDALAKWVGIDDGDPRITWRYEQRTGEPGVEVLIAGDPTDGGEAP